MDVESKTVNLKTPDGVMPVYASRPKGASGKLPGVIVIQEAFGLNDNIRSVADRIAAEGYHAAAPNLYHREGGKAVGYDELADAIGLMQRLKDDQILADLRALVASLKGDAGVRADRIGITGFCMGGRVSYLAASELPEIRASVPFYGGGIPVDRTPNLGAPILLHFGENDPYIPLANVEEIRSALEREKKSFEIHVYAGSGHGFFCSERADYNPEAAKLAWERTKAFFAKHLKA